MTDQDKWRCASSRVKVKSINFLVKTAANTKAGWWADLSLWWPARPTR